MKALYEHFELLNKNLSYKFWVQNQHVGYQDSNQWPSKKTRTNLRSNDRTLNPSIRFPIRTNPQLDWWANDRTLSIHRSDCSNQSAARSAIKRSHFWSVDRISCSNQSAVGSTIQRSHFIDPSIRFCVRINPQLDERVVCSWPRAMQCTYHAEVALYKLVSDQNWATFSTHRD
jgi:hypothetical protein